MSARTMLTASFSHSSPVRKKCTAFVFSNGTPDTCVAFVCRDHADNLLLALKPGEKQSYEECYFERFDITDH